MGHSPAMYPQYVEPESRKVKWNERCLESLWRMNFLMKFRNANLFENCFRSIYITIASDIGEIMFMTENMNISLYRKHYNIQIHKELKLKEAEGRALEERRSANRGNTQLQFDLSNGDQDEDSDFDDRSQDSDYLSEASSFNDYFVYMTSFHFRPMKCHEILNSIVRNGTIKIGDLSFEEVEKFKYLGATVTNINDTREEIKLRINMGNVCYYSVEKLLSSSLLSKNLKTRRLNRAFSEHFLLSIFLNVKVEQNAGAVRVSPDDVIDRDV
ncbi:hypothetical protein ANN_25811 [Periplaneta americana]|uniref:Uncharacterized protein n=1 Tax=Periplaneta americana TaxID=6978 RepID=A0ABQ8S479_PERAM|nr:hypothetical protein ANN_25811 [Periplaneta americana]